MTPRHNARNRDRGEFLDRIDVIHQVSNGDRIKLVYDSANSEMDQTIFVTVGDAHLTEWTTLDTDDAARYKLIGEGMADRNPGEVMRVTDRGWRRVGWFKRAYRIIGPTEMEGE